MYHAGWAWAGSSPYKGTKLLASHFGGTRNPMAVRWPTKIKPDAKPRAQFHHVNDVVPTIYEILGITPPRTVNGVEQDPIDGVSFAYSLGDLTAKGELLTQYFEVMGSRAIYHDGWMACAFGPRVPWLPGLPPGIREWTPDKDVWELYNLEEDWSQANDLASRMPEKLAQMKELFLIEATKNKALPIGGGLWVPVLRGHIRVEGRTPILAEPATVAFTTGHAMLTFSKKEDEMSEQEGETVLLDKLAGSLLDYVEDEDALDSALRLREDLLDKRLMMTARLQHKMVDNLADGQEHRAQAQQFVQSMIDKFRVEVILDS